MTRIASLKKAAIKKAGFTVFLCVFAISFISSALELPKSKSETHTVQTVSGARPASADDVWLSHEHVLVDFIGADKVVLDYENHDQVIEEVLPYLNALKRHGVTYFVDATPDYIGRDVRLLEKLQQKTGINFVTNTGFYGARNKKFVPQYALEATPQELADLWINEYENGIGGTTIKPGFIKIGVDSLDPLHPVDRKLITAAAITHKRTGLTIASHTGSAVALWPQLDVLKEADVPLESFIWVHAHQEQDNQAYVKAAKLGVWVSLDGLGWEIEKHVEKLVFAKEQGILKRVLISHDAGWYDPQKSTQTIKPYTDIFTKLRPKLQALGFTEAEFDLLLKENPAKAFSVKLNH